MSTHITTRRLTLSVAAAAAALALTALGPAGQDSPDAQKSQDDNPHNLPIVTLDFRGGTVQKYVEQLQDAREDVNIMVDPEASDVIMPPVQLRKVMLTDALWLLQDLSPPDGRFSLRVSDFHTGPEGLTAPVFRVSAIPRHASNPPLHTMVWSVQPFLADGMKSEAIVTAIDTALALDPSLGEAQVKFHAETGLIIARAHPDQVRAIDEVISHLRPKPQQPPGEVALRQLQAECERLMREIAALEEENRMLRAQLREREGDGSE